MNKEIVKAGYAWWYRKYLDDVFLSHLEAGARVTGKGGGYEYIKTPYPLGSGGEARQDKRSFDKWQVNPSTGDRECGMRRYCKELSSRREALFYLQGDVA
ncbi:beta/alpha barrel domain-containing protein [Syntrophotalea acetylenica]|uniref:hypothetical protein n=1 Tax=Syntrophotalea acetylenica TaxID=29542 RepID=UPI0011AB374B|nr:hypothetical protein [Syntrophotalea acetylenica]